MSNAEITKAYVEYRENHHVLRLARMSLENTRSEIEQEFHAALVKHTGISHPYVGNDECTVSPLGSCIFDGEEPGWLPHCIYCLHQSDPEE